MRAATMTIRRRIVAVVALASAPAAMVPAALVRLKAMTATTNHAAFAVNTPEGVLLQS